MNGNQDHCVVEGIAEMWWTESLPDEMDDIRDLRDNSLLGY